MLTSFSIMTDGTKPSKDEDLLSNPSKFQTRSKRNRRLRRLETKPDGDASSAVVLTVKRYSRSIITYKYHNHASAYSLQTVCCRFIYLHEENANAAKQIARMIGNPMNAGAQQPISTIAAGDSAVTPPSILDNGRVRSRPAENAAAFGNEQELNKSRFILN